MIGATASQSSFFAGAFRQYGMNAKKTSAQTEPSTGESNANATQADPFVKPPESAQPPVDNRVRAFAMMGQIFPESENKTETIDLEPKATQRGAVSETVVSPDTKARVRNNDFLHWQGNSDYSVTIFEDASYTDDEPKIYVEVASNDGNIKAYTIDVNKVDPKNATRMEMHALAAYRYKNEGVDMAKDLDFMVLQAKVLGMTDVESANYSMSDFVNERINFASLAGRLTEYFSNAAGNCTEAALGAIKENLATFSDMNDWFMDYPFDAESEKADKKKERFAAREAGASPERTPDDDTEELHAQELKLSDKVI